MSSSDSEDESQLYGASTPKKRKIVRGDIRAEKQKHRVQKYRKEWEKDPNFSPWLKPDPTDTTKAKCIWCNSSLRADVSVIKLHKKSSKHEKIKSACDVPSTSSIKNFLQKPKNSSFEKDVSDAEIKICGFLAAHNIPFSAIDELIPCLKSAIHDSKILLAIKMKRMKATKVITNVIGASHKEEIAELLKTQKFSVLTDESTDCSTVKTSCAVVRFYHPEQGRILSLFWDLSNIFPENDPQAAEEGATGRRLYELIIQSFKDKKIPLQNIIGFGCDGASVNLGIQNSIASRLKDSCPGIIIMKCVCHSLHLAASKACELHMPRSCEDLARNVHNYVQHSAKRVAGLAVFQKFLNVAVHKMLHPAQTRWLSLLSVNERMLEQWEALRLYFTERHIQERTVAAESIYVWLCDPFVKMFYEFLAWILPKVTKMNALFQSESVLLPSLATKMETSFREILSAYMEHEYVNQTPLNQIQTERCDKFIPLRNMYLGVQVMEAMKNPIVMANAPAVDDFYRRCRSFMAKLCQGIQDRFDFDNPLLKMLHVLQPSKALAVLEREGTPSLLPLCDYVPRAKPKTVAAMQVLDDEWRRLPLDCIPEDVKNETDVDVFWHKVAQLRDTDGCRSYIELPGFALAALCVPHSNAQCERVFSKYNLIKTNIRNRLITTHVEGAMLASQAVKTNKGCCGTFTPTPDMHKRMCSKNLYGTEGSGDKDNTGGGNEDINIDFMFE